MGAEGETKQDTDEADGFVVAEGWRVCWVKRAAAPEVQEVISRYILWAWWHSFVAFHLIFRVVLGLLCLVSCGISVSGERLLKTGFYIVLCRVGEQLGTKRKFAHAKTHRNGFPEYFLLIDGDPSFGAYHDSGAWRAFRGEQNEWIWIWAFSRASNAHRDTGRRIWI